MIHGKVFFVPEHYPKDTSGELEYDNNLIEELDTKTTGVLRKMCKHNPPCVQPTYKDKRADLIYKRVFCDFIQSTRVCTSYNVYIYIYIYIYIYASPACPGSPHTTVRCHGSSRPG